MLIMIFCISGGILLLVGLASWLYKARQMARLRKKLELSSEETGEIRSILQSQVVSDEVIQLFLLEGISLFDVMYHMSKISPYTIEGIEHLHHAQNFHSLGDLINFMKTQILPDTPSAWRGMVHKYKGYTGESHAFANLQAGGHHVQVPESGTAPGYDMTVDGTHMNVKITDHPQYIGEHLRAHPDIPVYTNVEMSHAFRDNPDVMIDPSISAQGVFHETSDTLSGIDNIGGWFHYIPWFTLVYSGTKNIKAVLVGKKDVGTALAHTTTDVVTKGVGGMIGAKVGLSVGLALAPFTGGLSVAIPFVSSGIGVILGAVGFSRLGNWWKGRHLRKAYERLQEYSEELVTTIYREKTSLRATVNTRAKQLQKLYKNESTKDKGIIRRWLFPTLKSTFFKMATSRLRKDTEMFSKNMEKVLAQYYENSIEKAGTLVMFLFRESEQWGIDLISQHPHLKEKVNLINQGIKDVTREAEKLE